MYYFCGVLKKLYFCSVKLIVQTNEKNKVMKKQVIYYIFVYSNNNAELIDVVWLKGYNREEAFTYLNDLWAKDEKEGKRYHYTLTDSKDNTLFSA